MFNIKENLAKLPETPGVYLHKDELGNVIYVGKAVNLKRRVSSYFVNLASHSPKVKAMVSHISEFEYITCTTEMEALILECNLIKRYEPKYNILLRDDKTYPYIKVTTGEKYPRVLKTRIIKKDGAKYFGPYSDVTSVNEVIDLLNKTYKLKRCATPIFRDGYRPCLNYHIKECEGVCSNFISREEYMKKIGEVLDFLSGRKKQVLDLLNEEMRKASDELRFEDAGKCRDQIRAINSIFELQRVTMVNGKDFDILLKVGRGETMSIACFAVRSGKLVGRETFSLMGVTDNETEAVSEFIKQYYVEMAIPPHEILLKNDIDDADLISEYISRNQDYRVKITVPERGEKRALLNLAVRDAIEMEKSLKVKVGSKLEKEEKIKEMLLNLIGTGEIKDYYRVESYDISNTNGVDTVGAMVVFHNEKAIKKNYRRFIIRTVEGPNDYQSLEEMLTRRFMRALAGDDNFAPLPDIIFMDGGYGQVGICLKVMKSLGLDIPTFGMAKDDSHRTRALIDIYGNELELKENHLLFSYLGTIQEEVHRFAIEYHRSLRNRHLIGSALDEIEGIGEKKRNSLLKTFGSIDEIKNKSIEEIMTAPLITKKDAENIVNFFKKDIKKQQ